MDARSYQAARRRTQPENVDALMQGALGAASEIGEVLGLIEKWRMQGHPIEPTKMRKELGDVFWYLLEIMDAFGFEFEDVLEANISKLQARFPEKFTTDDSVARIDGG